MRRKLFIALLALAAAGLSMPSNAATTASQTITGTLNPFVTVKTVSNATTSVSINNDGTLSANLTPGFQFTSNNKNGATATISVKVGTSDGNQVDAIYGGSSASSGKIVLANITNLPTASAVRDALSNSTSAANNANAISYQITWNIDNTNNGRSPVFDATGNTISGNVLTKNGTSALTINVDKNLVGQNTFNEDDTAGSYQATIYCTSALL